MNYRLHRGALAEHLAEVAFYEDRLAGLGKDYLAAFEATMGRICASPDAFPVVGPSGLRKAPLPRFPFHVIYRADDQQILVLAIAHQRRRPMYWSGRLEA